MYPACAMLEYASMRLIDRCGMATTFPTFFDADVSRTLIVVGDPWYTSGAHMWNGTTATLNPNPAIRKTRAMISGGSIAGCTVKSRWVLNSARSVVEGIEVVPAIP